MLHSRLDTKVAFMVQGAPIQKGRFTWVTEADRKEKWIVASIGKYSVLWNFRWALAALHTSSDRVQG